MSDTQIIELDEPEPAATPLPWRAGSLTIVVAPLVVVALVVSLAMPRLADRVTAKAEPTAAPEPTRGAGLLITAGPQVTTQYVVMPSGASSTESGNAEVLEDQQWIGLGPSYPAWGDVAEAVLNGAAYVIGGTGTTEDGLHVYRYDVHTGAREPVPDLPVSIDHAMAATLKDRIYVFGSYVFGRPTDRVFSLGANDAHWIEHSPMPAARAAGGAAVVGDRIYIVGGVTENGGWTRDTWAYDTAGPMVDRPTVAVSAPPAATAPTRSSNASIRRAMNGAGCRISASPWSVVARSRPPDGSGSSRRTSRSSPSITGTSALDRTRRGLVTRSSRWTTRSTSSKAEWAGERSN